MKKPSIPAFLLCALLVAALFPTVAHADLGPHPYVSVDFSNMADDQLCYGTLLSETDYSGPAGAWNGDEDSAQKNGPGGEEIWRAFVDYEDADGFYFLQGWWECSNDEGIHWSYYPPETFKILLYFPEPDSYAVSGIYHTYGLSSYYQVNLSGMDIASIEQPESFAEPQSEPEPEPLELEAEEEYDPLAEAGRFAVRVAITLLIELLMALLFGLGQKKRLYVIAAVNLLTQVLLNVMLNVLFFTEADLEFFFWLLMAEAAVFIAETLLYCKLLGRLREKAVSRVRIILYTLCANAVSFLAGFVLVVFDLLTYL